VAPNGTLVRLAPGPAEIIDHVPVGRLARDGDILLPLDGETLRDRRKLLWNGAAAISLVLGRDGKLLAEPKVTLRGIEDPDSSLAVAIASGLSEMVADLTWTERSNDAFIEDAAAQTLRRVVRAHLGKKPLTDVHIVRI
jgi:ribonuclease J